MNWRVCTVVTIASVITVASAVATRAADNGVAGGLPAEIQRAKTAEATLAAANATLAARIAALETAAASLSAAVATLQAADANLSASVAALQAANASLSASVATLQTANANLETRIVALETGISGYEIVFHEEIQNLPGTVDAMCPPGKKVLGGGGSSDNPFFTLFASRPLDDDGWHVAQDGPFNTPHAARAWAICAPAP